MIPRLRPEITVPDIAAAFLARSSVEDFECAFARLAAQSEAVGFPYGRTGMLLLFEAMGLRDCEIICPAYTCVVVAHAIVLSGNRPVFVDSADGDFNMDLDAAERMITERTGALIATSIHGYPVDLDRLARLRARHPHVAVVQDCAHSFAAEHHGRKVNQGGTAAVFGLNVSKLMTSIFGGMVTTDDPELASRLRHLRDMRLSRPTLSRSLLRAIYLTAASTALTPTVFTIVDRIRRLGLIDRFTEYYSDDKIDMPNDHLVGLTRAEASVGIRQARRYDAIVAHRRSVAAVYDEELRDCPDLIRPPLVAGATYSHYVARVADPDSTCLAMRRQGVELGRIIDYCVPDMRAYAPYVPHGTRFPNTQQLNSEVINLPLHVSEDGARTIAGKIKRTLRTARPNPHRKFLKAGSAP